MAAALEKERAVVVVAVNNKEEVAFVATVDLVCPLSCDLWSAEVCLLVSSIPPWNMGKLSVSIGRALLTGYVGS